MLFSISARLAREAGLSLEKTHPSLPLMELIRREKACLYRDARHYLSRSERSPLAFERWLGRRGLPGDWEREIKALMEDENYLSEGRYAEAYLHRALQRGNKPFEILKKELKRNGVSKESIDGLFYPEREALANFVRRSLARKSTDPIRLRQSLFRRGFPVELVKGVLSTFLKG